MCQKVTQRDVRSKTDIVVQDNMRKIKLTQLDLSLEGLHFGQVMVSMAKRVVMKAPANLTTYALGNKKTESQGPVCQIARPALKSANSSLSLLNSVIMY